MTKKLTLRMRATVMVVGLALALAVVPGNARAADPLHPDLLESVNALRTAQGPRRYTELRWLWGLWDQTDPIQVEEAIRQAAASPGWDPPIRAYAELLGAYARRRRGDLAGARKVIRDLGFVNQWLVLGPFDNDGKAGLARTLEPESLLAEPLDVQRGHDGKERTVRWRPIPDIYPYGWLDFGDLMRPTEQICAYATTFVRSTTKPARNQQASLWIGVGGAYRAFWNGEEVLSDTKVRKLDHDRMAATVTVRPEWNRLTVKVCGDDTAPMLTVRMADARGAPMNALEASAEPAHAEKAAKNAVAASTTRGQGKVVIKATKEDASIRAPGAPPKRKGNPGRVRGPLQLFERATAGKAPSPANLEAYARYLLLTGGDDPSENQARDLARRSADRAPTADRLLLAGRLAEDRNQQRQWIERAEKLAAGKPNVEVLLARAGLTRTGANWRDAVPYYDKVLAIDPDNTEAVLGRVDLYNEAGLVRTALVTLERAVERNPRAVALLRIYALQLANLGRHTEAEEVQDRYAAFRFDDPTFQVARIDVAVARRNRPLAEHWIKRLLATDPDSAYHLGVAARAYLALGKRDRAIAMFHKALEMAPEDTDTMKRLADLHGELGQNDQQLRLLRKILVLRPQFKDVREYVEHIEPRRQRADEAYAWKPERFLGLRHADAAGFHRRWLRDLQVTTVFQSGLSSSFRQVVYQVLTDEAAAAGREYAFPYQADRQVVQLRAGRVFRADGRTDEAIESNVGPADNPAIAMYTSARTFYVQFPRLNVGDVVELQYRIEDVTPDNAFADYFGEVNIMQAPEPKLNAEYIVIAPRSRPLHIGVFNLKGLKRTEKTKGKSRIYRFFDREVPPILPEPNMPPWSEILGHVHVSTYRSWNDVGKWYWGLAKDQLIPDDVVRKKAEELTRGLSTDEEKVRAIYGYVVQKTRYVALEFGIYGYKPRRVAQTFARGWGDCKDKASLIESMLKVVGIPSNIVVLRTALRGRFPNAPASLAPFDHAILYVPSLDLYLDGTAEYTGSRELPAFDRGALGLIVGPGGAKLVTLPHPPAEDTQRVRKLEATVAADGSARLALNYTTTGAYAAEWRHRYHGDSTRKDRILGDTGREFPGFALAKGKAALDTSDLENIEKPVEIRIRGRAPSFARKEGAELSIPVTSSDRYVSKFARMRRRKLDVTLRFKSTVEERWTVRIPPGMKVKSLPASRQTSTPFGSFSLTVSSSKGVVTVRSQVKLTKERIKVTEYPAFTKFCEAIDRGLAQRLVVGK